LSKSFVLAGVCAAMVFGASAARAGTTIDFSGPVTTGPTAAPGVWSTDRFAPSQFFTSGGTLHENLAGSDFQGAGSFYNTQGRALTVEAGTLSMSIDLYVSQNYVGTDGRLAGFWGVAQDAVPEISAYPLIELTDEGGHLNFVGWDNDGSGSFFNIASADALVGTWQTLTISLNTTTDLFTYTAGGVSLTTSGEGSTGIGSVILQGHNTGSDLAIQWDNLNTSVPEPAAWSLMILGLGGVGAALRRKAARSALA
jgi:hypothetical protein